MSKIVVKYFGKLTDITKKPEEIFEIESPSEIGVSEISILEKYSELKNQVYVLFHNRNKVTDKKKLLKNQDELCFMPPFTGG